MKRTGAVSKAADREERYRDAGWPLFRICYGLFYVPHGGQKLFGWFGGSIDDVARAVESIGFSPGLVWANGLGGLELAGGILLAAGLFTRPVALLFAVFMFVATFFYNSQFGYFWPRGGMEVPLLLMLLALAIALRGGGELSLDRRLGLKF